VPTAERARVRKEIEAELAAARPEDLAKLKSMAADPCGEETVHFDIGPLTQKYEPQLREACRKIVADTPTFGRALYQNVPKMMFIFLPLIAMIMAILYVGSGRYYVEHLLFFVHFHAFVFLAGIALLLLENVTDQATGGTKATLTIVTQAFEFVMFLYIPYYLYRAMRRVYGQGRFVTLLKYSVLGVAYAVSLVVTGIGLLFYTALTL
jgi:hypothetical protein